MTAPISVVRSTLRVWLAAIAVASSVSMAQEVNYDEAAVPAYSLTDPLVQEDGTPESLFFTLQTVSDVVETMPKGSLLK